MKTLHVAAAMILHGDRILATQRGDGTMKGQWEFPGGKIEPGETGEQAIVREIQEELATTIAPDRFLTTVEYDYPAFHLSMDCYLCHVVTGKLELLEHESAKWLSKDQLRSVAWLPADLQVIEYLEQNTF